jgi:hypothetical protein
MGNKEMAPRFTNKKVDEFMQTEKSHTKSVL